jgi:hypothetical protein
MIHPYRDLERGKSAHVLRNALDEGDVELLYGMIYGRKGKRYLV